ncbi:MAG: AraC family transcriptional regulator [Myxococcales bacterium]|nr:AraC family transcriptional regulator [Myxococcales bacterium]
MTPSPHSALIPPHIDGFIVQTDLRLSRFSVMGEATGAAGDGRIPERAEHSRAELELSLTLRGRASGLLGTQRAELRPQSMLWVLPRQPHLIVDASPDFLAWVLVFRRRLVRRVCTSPAGHPLTARGDRGAMLRRLPRAEVDALGALYAGVPVGAGRDVFNAGLGYVLSRSWLAFERAPQEPDPGAVHPCVRAAAWLLRDGQAGLSNEELASRVGLSAQRLSRLFKAQMGTNLADFRNRQRIAHVVAHMHRGDANLTALALDAGYGSYSQFHRVFKRFMGCAPAAYARKRGGRG